MDDTGSTTFDEAVHPFKDVNSNENAHDLTADSGKPGKNSSANADCNDNETNPNESSTSEISTVPIDDTGQNTGIVATDTHASVVCNGISSTVESAGESENAADVSSGCDESQGFVAGDSHLDNKLANDSAQCSATKDACDSVPTESRVENALRESVEIHVDGSEEDDSSLELSSSDTTNLSDSGIADETRCSADEPDNVAVSVEGANCNAEPLTSENCPKVPDVTEFEEPQSLEPVADSNVVLAPQPDTVVGSNAAPDLEVYRGEDILGETVLPVSEGGKEMDIIALLLNANYDVPKSLTGDRLNTVNGSNGLVPVVIVDPGEEDVIYDVPPEFEDEMETLPDPPAKDYCVEDVDQNAKAVSDGENFYEEIPKDQLQRRKSSLASVDSKGPEEGTLFTRGSLVEEVMTEVERVQQCHDQVLQELNLDIENLIMPSTPSVSPMTESGGADTPSVPPHLNLEVSEARNHNLCTRTLPPLPVESADEPVPLRPAPSIRDLHQTKSAPAAYHTPSSSTPVSTPSGVKHWLSRLPSLSSFREKKSRADSSDGLSWRWSVGFTEEPIYMLYDDSYRLHAGPRYEADDGIYEDIDKHSQRYTMPSSSAYAPLPKFQYADRQSLSSTELNEDNSDTESVRSGGSLSVASFKGKLLNFGRKLSRQEDKPKELKVRAQEGDGKAEGKLTRLFSKRKGYDMKGIKNRNVVIQTPEESKLPQLRMSSRHQPPILPPPPTGLSPEQVKRRYIVGTLVHSENSYIASLKKLVNDYKKPLEESSPPILSANKIAILFHRLPEILQCHTNFCIALAACVQRWDKEESMGEVFLHAFSKTSVLDIYSDYINNFSEAMDLAKVEAKRKSAFTDFLKVKQITSHDRLSFFGLMVKPVQRFPQFILLLQDLLRHTPQRHHDRMALQLALTQMETMADMLNERKRESDQAHAVKDVLRHVSAKSAAKSLSEGTRYLLRQDMLTQLIFNQNGQWMKSKDRKLFLLNDLLVCVSVGPSPSESNTRKSARLSFKWTVPITEVEVHEDASPILNRMVYAMSTGQSSATKTDSPNGPEGMEGVKNIYQDLNDLLHDFEVTSRITALVTTLRKSYTEVSVEILQGLSHSIQQTIQQKDEEIKWIDSCCLQFSVPLKSKTGKSHRDLLIFQSKSMDTKQEWLTDVRLAQLARDANNSPAWDIPEQERRPSTKIPLFVKAVPIHSSRDPTEVKCGCYHRTMSTRLLGRRPQDMVWLCSTDGVNSRISVHTLRQMGLRDVYNFDMAECRISSMESVPGVGSPSNEIGLQGDSIWMGTESRRVLVYGGVDAEHYQEIGCAIMSASVLHIKFHLNQVYVALANGTLAVFQRNSKGCWLMKDFQVVTLGSDPVTCLLPVNNSVYCGCGRKVWVIDSATAKVTLNHSVHHDHMGSVYAMAHSGIGLWLNLRNTPLVCLYHAETFQHLQDINITSSVRRVLAEQNRLNSPRYFCVTTLAASRGLLWIGTNVGVVLSIPLPRLQGMPILGRRANMAYHANVGPVSMILVLQPQTLPALQDPKTNKESSNVVESTTKATENNYTPAPVPIYSNAFRSSRVSMRGDNLCGYGAAKTLPRGWKTHVSSYDPEYSIYGLYDNLLNVREGAEDPVNALEEDLRHSDPDLIPSLVSTLDRRVRLNSGRPRSLDLANLTGANDAVCVSSSSEDGGSGSQSLAELPAYTYSIHSQIKEMEDSETGDNEQAQTTDKEPARKPPVVNQPVMQRSVVTLVGGRGYVDLRKPLNTKEKSNSHLIPSDAYAILWEMKV